MNNNPTNTEVKWCAGHPLYPTTGSGNANKSGTGSENGIELLQNGVARLWQRGQVVAEARHDYGDNHWQFWYELAFRECFPQVEYWWFGSYWTGKVRLGYPDQLIKAGRVAAGHIQYVDEYTDFGQWTIENRPRHSEPRPRPLAPKLSSKTGPGPGGSAPANPAPGAAVPVPIPVKIVAITPFEETRPELQTFVEVGVPLPPFEEEEDANLPLKLKLARMALEVLRGERLGNQWELVTSLVNRVELEELLATTEQGWQVARPFSQTPPTLLLNRESTTATNLTATSTNPYYYQYSFRELFCYSLGLIPSQTPQPQPQIGNKAGIATQS